METWPTAGNDITGIEAGFGWSQGPLSLGVQYGSTEGSTEEAGANKATILAFNAGYNLGPGINVGARVATGEISEGADYTQFLLGTFLNF